jgi:hypothetical protein
MIYLFEMEYERRKKLISANSQTTFAKLVTVYVVCCVLVFGMTYLPDFFRPVMVLPFILCAVSNPLMAVSVGLFFDVLLALVSGGSFYSLACYVILTVFGGVFSQAYTHRRYRTWLSFLCIFTNLMIPDVLYYLCYKESTELALLYGLGNGVLTAFSALFAFPFLRRRAMREVDNRYVQIISAEYSQVKALKDYSMEEYRHAVHASNLAHRCAKKAGLKENVCLAAGFYYRMGQWLGEPCVQNGVKRAVALCFPDEVIQILAEYYGEEKMPSTPESAVVHMVDALLYRLDDIKKETPKSIWGSEILIYQTLNEFSESGMYDESGLSMNHYLKIREILAKEDLLH